MNAGYCYGPIAPIAANITDLQISFSLDVSKWNIQLSAGFLLLQKIRLGWVVSGDGSHIDRKSFVVIALKDVVNSLSQLDERFEGLLRKFLENQR